jgi:hypothetical protein
MILPTKSQPTNSTYSGFFSSKDASNTRKSMSVSRQNSLISRHLSAIVGHSAKYVLNYLVTVIPDSKVNVQISRDIISEETGLSTRTITSAIRKLENFGFINVTANKAGRGINGGNSYSLTEKFYTDLSALNEVENDSI